MRRCTLDDPDALVRAAAAGDEDAWDALVERYTAMVWSIARTHRLSGSDAADVVQTTWLRFVEHLHRLRNPGAVGTWLATTARNESLRTVQRTGRTMPTSEETQLEPRVRHTPPPDAALLRRERETALWAAFRQLAPACRQLLRLLFTDPPPTYEEVRSATGMPIGSIGPTRARCLQRLRTLLERADAHDVVAATGRGDARRTRDRDGR